MSNRVGIDDDSKTVASNATESKKLCECLNRRKVKWLTFIVIALAIIITIPIVMLKTIKANSEKISATGSQNVVIIYFEVNIREIISNDRKPTATTSTTASTTTSTTTSTSTSTATTTTTTMCDYENYYSVAGEAHSTVSHEDRAKTIYEFTKKGQQLENRF
ncbi:unnamed protein product [Adineta steineri]|uniref:Uncharacterized protein n=1 Tax=Adineta steineri TaxID=433720 RepID=A0A820BIT6_9BILA|nr:unnamed protein product [Adineta steineri]